MTLFLSKTSETHYTVLLLICLGEGTVTVVDSLEFGFSRYLYYCSYLFLKSIALTERLNIHIFLYYLSTEEKTYLKTTSKLRPPHY